jgi:hypothetical protein
MKVFKAILSSARDTSTKEEAVMATWDQDPSPIKIKSAELTFKSIGPFPDVTALFGKTVEIRIID